MQEPDRIVQNKALYLAIGLVFTLVVFSYLVYEIRTIVLLLLLTLLFSIIVSGPVDALQRRGVPRGAGTPLVLGVLAGLGWLAGTLIAPVVENQARSFVRDLPSLVAEIQGLATRLQNASGIRLGAELDPERLRGLVSNFFSGDVFATAADIGGSIANGLSLAVVALIATVYLVLRPAPLVEGFVAFFPAGWRSRVRDILRQMYETVQRWFLGQLATMTLIGLLSAAAYSLIGLPFAVLLGIFGGLVAFVPFIGPTIAVIPAVLIALTISPITAVWVLVAYLAIQTVESNVIQPVVMSQAVELHPAVVVFALLTMGTLFGFIGLFLAVPLVAALHVLSRELWVKRMDELGTDPDTPEMPDTPEHGTGKRKPGKLEPGRRLSRLWRAVRDLVGPSGS